MVSRMKLKIGEIDKIEKLDRNSEQKKTAESGAIDDVEVDMKEKYFLKIFFA